MGTIYMVKFYENITNETQDSINDLYNQMKNGKPCALTVYHPYCSHCMNMKPNWKAMGEHMEKKYNDEFNKKRKNCRDYWSFWCSR